MTSWHKCDDFPHYEETFGIRPTWSFFSSYIYHSCDVNTEDGISKRKGHFLFFSNRED